MIITRTPFRLSFLGGGSDLPSFFQEESGKVLSVALDKYCYLTCRFLPPFFSHRHRIVYSIVEMVDRIDDIQHPVVKKVFELFGVDEGVELHHDGDLPAWSGLGSSSSFTVGLLHALKVLLGQEPTKEELAREAIEVERVHLGENVGSQDQYAASFGGLNRLVFNQDGSVAVNPIQVSTMVRSTLENSVLLVYSGRARKSSAISGGIDAGNPNIRAFLREMANFVDHGVYELQRERLNLKEFGRLINHSYRVKKQLSPYVATDITDEIVTTGLGAGAIGAKVMGSGGGGFVALLVEEEKKHLVKRVFKDYVVVDPRFDFEGSKILFRS